MLYICQLKKLPFYKCNGVLSSLTSYLGQDSTIMLSVFIAVVALCIPALSEGTKHFINFSFFNPPFFSF